MDEYLQYEEIEVPPIDEEKPVERKKTDFGLNLDQVQEEEKKDCIHET